MRTSRLLAPFLSAAAVAGVVAVAVLVTSGSGGGASRAPADVPVVETALPTPAPSEKGCAGWGRGASSPAPDQPGRTASVTRLERDGTLTWTRALPVDGHSTGHYPPLVLGERTLVLAGGTLRSYATATGREQWVVPAEGAAYGLWDASGLAVVLLDQVSQNARFVGYDPQTGEVRWTYRIPGNGLMGDQVLAADGSLVTVLSGGNQLQVLDTATGAVRWTAERGGGPYAAAVDDVVVQPGGGRLHGYRLQDGAPVWSAELPEDQDEVAVRVGAGVLVTVPTVQGPGFGTGVHAFDPATGAALWSREGGPQALRVAGELPGAVVVADDDFSAATLTAVEARSGQVRWSEPARTVYEQPLVSGAGVLVVPERRGESYVVARRDAATGELLDESPLPHELSLRPLTGDRYLFQTYGSPDGGPGTVAVGSLTTGEQEFAVEVRHAAHPPASLPDGAVIVQGSDPHRACVG